MRNPEPHFNPCLAFRSYTSSLVGARNGKFLCKKILSGPGFTHWETLPWAEATKPRRSPNPPFFKPRRSPKPRAHMPTSKWNPQTPQLLKPCALFRLHGSGNKYYTKYWQENGRTNGTVVAWIPASRPVGFWGSPLMLCT